MYGTDYFLFVHGEGEHLGTLIPTGTWDSLERGTIMDRQSSYEATHCSPGNGDMQGILSNRVTATGPSYEKMSLGYPDLDVLKGHAVTLVVPEDGALLEVEGEASKAYNADTVGHLVTSGTGAITGSTAVGTALSVKNGRWYVAQSGDWVLGEVKAQLTPVADDTNIRVLIEVRRGAKL